MIGNAVERPLHSSEIACAVCADGELRRVGTRCFRLRRECPLLAVDTGKSAWNAQNVSVDLDIVGLAVFQQVVMQLDGRRIVVDDDRIKMKSVRKPADDG